jgi:hypothetical protein
VNSIMPVLVALHTIAPEIQLLQPLCHEQSLATISRSAANLYLFYCHVCVQSPMRRLAFDL